MHVCNMQEALELLSEWTAISSLQILGINEYGSYLNTVPQSQIIKIKWKQG